MLNFKVVCFVICVCASLKLCFANHCKVPPQFRCASVEIAKSCGVYDECKLRFFESDTNASASAVEVSVYYESYCPDSIGFVTTMLFPTWQKLMGSKIMKPVLIPYGKAISIVKPDGTYAFTCQHGKKECVGNTIQNCIIKHTSGKAELYLPVIQCMEKASSPDNAAEACVGQAGLDWMAVNQCAQGSEGNKLMYEAGLATQSLKPPLNWVPWIVVNGVHTDAIQSAATSDLLKLVCDTYQGASPAACKTK